MLTLKRLRGGGPAGTEESLLWSLIKYFFQLYESYEIKFPMKVSSFTVPLHLF